MKKIILKILVVFSVVAFTGSLAWAGIVDTNFTVTDTISGATAGTITVVASPGVQFAYEADTTNNGTAYAMGAANSNGTKAYGSTHDFEGIAVTVNDYDEDTDYPAIPAVGGDWTDGTWNLLGTSSSSGLPQS